jgi:hypothetical protein
MVALTRRASGNVSENSSLVVTQPTRPTRRSLRVPRPPVRYEPRFSDDENVPDVLEYDSDALRREEELENSLDVPNSSDEEFVVDDSVIELCSTTSNAGPIENILASDDDDDDDDDAFTEESSDTDIPLESDTETEEPSDDDEF